VLRRGGRRLASAGIGLLAVGLMAQACSGGAPTPKAEGAPTFGASTSVVAAPWGGRGIVLWVGWSDLADMSDAELTAWHDHGVTAVVGQVQYLTGMGGSNSFTGATPTPPGIEATLASSRIGERAKAAGISSFLGFYFTDLQNTRTPLAEWFDNAAWTSSVLPKVEGVAAAARELGFAGVAVDQELYPQDGRVRTATWNWSYPGNSHSQAAVRAEVVLRGRQLMQSLLAGFPGLSIVAYDTQLPGTWDAEIQAIDNGETGAYDDSVQINLWDGMTGVDGYGSILFLDADFYKTPGVSGASWNQSLAYEDRTVYPYLSKNLANWSYAATHLSEAPFGWINSDGSDDAYGAARPPAYVKDQLASFRQWTTDGVFGVYNANSLDQAFYQPYYPAMDAATAPLLAPATKPSLQVRPVARPVLGSVDLSGEAADSDAIRFVLCATGGQKVVGAVMTRSGSTDPAVPDEVGWTCSRVPTDGGPVKVVATDIRGVSTVVSVTPGR